MLTLRILLVGSRDRQLEEAVRVVAQSVTTAPTLSGLVFGTGEEPHVVVVDIREQASVPHGLTAVRRAHPAMGIILVASKLDPEMMLEAMRSGVNEFLADPVGPADLRAAVERVANLKPGTAVGRTYAFIGAKGGVGTTTVAVNVATALAKSGSGRVMMIDLHPAHGDAALFFGSDPRFSVADALENTHRLDAAYLKGLVASTRAGVDLLGSSDRPVIGPVDSMRVRTLLDFVSQHYAHVVVDVPRNDPAVLDALDGAVQIVVVANQELSTVRGAARIAGSLRHRYGKDRIQVVVSRYDTVAEIGQDDIEKVTGGRVRHLFPSNYRLAVEALNKGRPIVSENHNKLAASLVGFAGALSGTPKKTETADTKTSGIFGRFTGRR
jgi:pilus assembly protein CpaE